MLIRNVSLRFEYKSKNIRHIYHISISIIPIRIGFIFCNDKKAHHKESIQMITTSFVLFVVYLKQDLSLSLYPAQCFGTYIFWAIVMADFISNVEVAYIVNS